MFAYIKQHGVRIDNYVSIFVANDANSERLQKLIASAVVSFGIGAVVRGAVQLDCQMSRWAIEIDDIRPDTVLPAKLEPVQLARLKMCPQERFRWRE